MNLCYLNQISVKTYLKLTAKCTCTQASFHEFKVIRTVHKYLDVVIKFLDKWLVILLCDKYIFGKYQL